MNKKKCLIPNWRTATHSVVFSNIVRNLGYEEFSPDLSVQKNFIPLFLSLIVFWSHLPQILACRKKNDIRSFVVRNVNLGFSINEKAIASSPDACFRFSVKGYLRILNGIYIFKILEAAFRRNEIGFVIGGDEAYPLFSIAAQLATRNQIPVTFLKGAWEVQAHPFDMEFLSAAPIQKELKLDGIAEDKELLTRAKKNLVERIHGSRISLHYMPQPRGPRREQQRCPVNAFWLYLHDFFDSPGIYGGNIFRDHVAWVTFTVDTLLDMGQSVVLKSHPNERPRNKPIIEGLLSRYEGKLNFVNNDIPLASVRESNCKAVITVYGTVIPEACFAGIPVIAAGRSPYSIFDVCYEAEDLQDYVHILRQACSSSGLLSKSADRAVLAECMVRIAKPPQAAICRTPFDDIPPNEWKKLGFGQRPIHNFERREVFLRSGFVRDYMESKLAGRNLAVELDLNRFTIINRLPDSNTISQRKL